MKLGIALPSTVIVKSWVCTLNSCWGKDSDRSA
jgi:hypothetical protein